MATNYNYNPNEVSLTVGPYLIRFDEFTVSREEEKYTYSVGTSGETTRTKNANDLVTLTITVPQASDNNDNLTTLYYVGDPVPVMVKDNLGTTVLIIPLATIATLPDVSFGKESGQREWTIKGTMPSSSIVGGNNRAGA